jgi:hypothetical protein
MEIVSRRHQGTRISVRLPVDCQNGGRRDDAKVAPIASTSVAGDVRMKKRA